MSQKLEETPGAKTRRAAAGLSAALFWRHALMHLSTVLVAVLVMQVSAGAALADESLFEGVKALEPDNLVNLVQARNANLEAARAAAIEAATRIKPAGSLDDPMLSYAIAPATIGSREIGTRQSVEVSQSLPWPGTISARRQKATAEADAVQSGTDARALEIVADTKAAFAEWAFVHAALNVNLRHQAHLRDLKAVAERRYAAGLSSQQDTFKAALELARMENEGLMLEAQRRTIQARMNALLNREPAAIIPPPVALNFSAHLPAFERLQEITMVRHPSLKGLASTVDANKSGVALARKGFYPDLSVQAGYDEMWDQKEMRPSVGVSLSVPLHWGRREAELDGARAAQKQAEWKLADKKAMLLAELAEAYATAVQAIQSVALHKERLLPLADAAASSALADYRSNRGDYASVITAARDKLDQELSLQRALADEFRAFAVLERAAGGAISDEAAANLFLSKDTTATGSQEHHP